MINKQDNKNEWRLVCIRGVWFISDDDGSMLEVVRRPNILPVSLWCYLPDTMMAWVNGKGETEQEARRNLLVNFMNGESRAINPFATI